jgi:hypothetical protein
VAAHRGGQLDDLGHAGLAEALDRGGGEPVGQVLDVAAERAAGLGEPAFAIEQAPGLQAALGRQPVLVGPAPGRLAGEVPHPVAAQARFAQGFGDVGREIRGGVDRLDRVPEAAGEGRGGLHMVELAVAVSR